MNRECAATITSTGNNAVVPSSSGIRLRREPQVALRRVTRRPHQPISRIRTAMLRSQTGHVLTEPRRRPRPADPLREHRRRHLRELGQQRPHPLLERRERRRLAGARSYFGGSVDATALATVLREIPNRSAIRVFGTPSAANLRINAQSSKVITLQSSSAHFSSGRTAQFSAVIDMTETIPFEGPCGGGAGMVTITYNSVFHVTQFDDGRYHVTGTQTGTFSFAPTDPALPNSSGSFTTWFGENGNSRTFNATSTFSVRGRTDDGEHVRFNVTTHITVAGSDVVVQFEKVSCG